MTEEKIIIKGGFRATLALLFSIVALVLSIITYNRTSEQTELNEQIRRLNEKVTVIKQETSERMDKVLKAAGEGLEKLSIEIEKKGEKQEVQKPEEQNVENQ